MLKFALNPGSLASVLLVQSLCELCGRGASAREAAAQLVETGSASTAASASLSEAEKNFTSLVRL